MTDQTAAMPDDTDVAPETPPDQAAPDAADETGGPTVLLTVMDNHDGTFSLIEGDETEPGEGDMGAAPEGESYDSPGALLKAILGLVESAQENASGEGSAMENFQAGYEGRKTKAPMMAGKGMPPA